MAKPVGAKQKKISIAGIEALRPLAMRALHEALTGDDTTRRWQTAIQLLKFMFPAKVDNASDRDADGKFRRIAERFADEVVQVAGAGKIPSDNSEVSN